MHNLIFLFFRRMRAPLLVLILAYTISIGGLVLVPGVDDQGNPWRFDFFHAVYFVSFMGSTIGFGEIPYAFSAAQRLWTLVAMYLTVIAWLYAIGNILALIQDPAFRRAFTEEHFAYNVRRLKTPFYLICGYGETGSLLVRTLNRRCIRSVVIDSNPENINALVLEDLNFDVPSLCADAREVRHLLEGGLKRPECAGVVALADVDEVNVKIAVTSKLLNPSLPVICRAQTQQATANLASFNTDYIINPFDIFADHLAMALRTPSVHLLYEWLISMPDQRLRAPIVPPRGHWVVCGFGRFGKAVHHHLHCEGIPMTIIEPRRDQAPEKAIIGRGTEAVTLQEAGIDQSVGIVAGTDNDSNNLSIIMTARETNPNLYLIARQNRRGNNAIFEAADLDLVMQSSNIIVWRILPLLTAPLLSRFLRLIRDRDEDWARQLLDRVYKLCAGVAPETWTVAIDAEQAQAVHAALDQGRDIRIRHLLREPQDRTQILPCFPLLLVRGEQECLLPDCEESLQIGDQLLFCAQHGASGHMAWILNNPNALEYVETGEERPDGYVWRWLAKRHFSIHGVYRDVKSYNNSKENS